MKKILITGGAGFIGVNLALDLLKDKENFVVIYDNLSRNGVERNLEYLISLKLKNFEFIKGDIRDYKKLKEVVNGYDEIYHLAAQVAVTKSVENPIEDFEINATGTLFLLEAVRENCPSAILIFSSTNKVYGELSHLKIKEGKKRYYLIDKKNGIDENLLLDFHSPYGCSKGTADQYIRDYFRIYQLKTVVFRQSCIYGPFQRGNEDQGWVAHFIIKAFLNEKINIYGDGKQVRDILFISDLINAYKLAVKNIEKCKGEIFNIGGGKENTFSLLELIEFLEKKLNKKIEYEFFDWRPGDQKVFISNNRKFEKLTGWKIKISKEKGIEKLIKWIEKNIIK
ncbi:MAG: GDP-mannose 4,6-dehydratase [Candidatus Omnitrophica bacterium]|nr:GDP-mannose 4,6-dehydratase [Candidatus Omnitrophota bacterium]MCM8811016.1 GDP-mannose 4,6-dehydratase [Candidatus Omnitrophota bacterium]